MERMKTNEIYLGDARELIKQVPDKSVDLIVTDPPYDMRSSPLSMGGLLKNRAKGSYDEIKEMNIYKGFDLSILDEFDRVMRKINIYLWCNKEQVYDYLTHYVKEKGCNFELLVWAKNNPPPFFNGHYLKDKEYCLYFWEKGVKPKIAYERGKTVYVTNTNVYDKDRFMHPTIKPIEIIENLIRNSTGGGVVLDPFAGSGTTCLACKHLGIEYIGFEINPKYHKIACDRLQGWNAKGELDLLDAISEREK